MRIPVKIEEFLTFAGTHALVWDSNHAALGISAAQSAAFKALVTTAQANFDAQVNARELAKAATVKQQDSTRDARATAADLIRVIEVYAAAQANPNTVYNLAQIPPPAAPSPQPAPGLPTDFHASLEPSGAVTIKWKMATEAGQGNTVWTIKRRTGGSGPFAFVGAVGRRIFTDNTVPAGSASIQYVVQGQRGDAVGPACSPFTVQFGVSGPGLAIVNQFSEAA